MRSFRVLIWTTVVLALCSGAGVLIICWRHAGVKAPVVAAPDWTMPNPNGFDYFVAAGKLMVEPKLVSAAALSDSKASLSEKKRLVGENAKALAKLREGLKLDCRCPFKYGIEARFPERPMFRNLASLLRIEGQVRAARGDYDSAESSCLDAMMLGAKVSRGGDTLGWLFGAACASIGRRDVWSYLPYIDAAKARAAIARVAGVQAKMASPTEIVANEKLVQLATLKQAFSGKCKSESAEDLARLSDAVKTNVLVRYSDHMDKLQVCVAAPYASRPREPEVNRSLLPQYWAADYLVDIWVPPISCVYLRPVRCRTENWLLAVALALQAYRAENGAYPADLNALVPRYLSALPQDPFNPEGTFGYRRTGKTYALWSVGPDLKDDGGKPAYDTNGPAGRPRYVAVEKSTGDIVAGVNDR